VRGIYKGCRKSLRYLPKNTVIQAGGKILPSAIHKLINSVWNKEELPDQWKEYINVPIHKKVDKTD
jgi:nucleoside recognition membrane protein YjiH